MGQPDPEPICTSIVERSNLSVRMGTRRFTSLTNAFSKKWENHWAAVSLWYAFYNFIALRCCQLNNRFEDYWSRAMPLDLHFHVAHPNLAPFLLNALNSWPARCWPTQTPASSNGTRRALESTEADNAAFGVKRNFGGKLGCRVGHSTRDP